MNIARNASFDDFLVKFETRLLWVKNKVIGPNQRKTLLTLAFTVLIEAIIMNLSQNVCLDDF